MKNIFLFSIVVIIIFCAPVLAYDWSTNPGDGSPENPYQISTPEQLNSIGLEPALFGKHFLLMNDIDMSAYGDTEYNIIGFDEQPFTGTFDGGGYAIQNLSYLCDAAIGSVGVFGDTDNATIRNLGVENLAFEVNVSMAGGIVGSQYGGQLVNCYCTGSIYANPYPGGYTHAGGLVGVQTGTISGCRSSVSVSVESASTIRNITYAGGLVGKQSGGVITHCYNTGEVMSSSSYSARAGGLAGEQMGGSVMKSFNVGNVSASSNKWTSAAGGVAGRHYSGSITDCYNKGAVAAFCVESIANSGGIAGSQWEGVISRCYSTGLVKTRGSGLSWAGGLAGSGGNIINSFWDTQTSGFATSAGGFARTTAEMMQSSNYIGWNTPSETVWTIMEGIDYPRLVWENQPGTPLPPDTLKDFLPGEGTLQNPYRISTAEQLAYLGMFAEEWDKEFQLENDIDLSDYPISQFQRIGIHGIPFSGLFNGNGHVIRNLNFSPHYRVESVGFFGSAKNAVVKNMGLENIFISADCSYAGGLVGNHVLGLISSCYTKGVILCSPTSYDCYAGGLVGCHWTGTISDCYSTVSVTCFDSDHKTEFNCAGGLVGYELNWPGVKVINCYSTGKVRTWGGRQDYQGGLAGYKYEGGAFVYNTIDASFWDMQSSEVTIGLGNIATDPSGVNGETTLAMKTSATFTSAGWDFVGEKLNGTEDIWWINEGNDYPRLWWEFVNTPPVTDAGEDVTAYAWVDGVAQIKLDGAGSYDPDGDALEYFWYNDTNELIATGAEPNVLFGVGQYEVTLIVNDGIEDSEPNSCTVTVLPAIEVRGKLIPKTLNRKSHRPHVIGRLELAGVSVDDLDPDAAMILMPGNIEAGRVDISGLKKKGGTLSLKGFFDHAALMEAIDDELYGQDQVEVTIATTLLTGQWMYGVNVVGVK